MMNNTSKQTNYTTKKQTSSSDLKPWRTVLDLFMTWATQLPQVLHGIHDPCHNYTCGGAPGR